MTDKRENRRGKDLPKTRKAVFAKEQRRLFAPDSTDSCQPHYPTAL